MKRSHTHTHPIWATVLLSYFHDACASRTFHFIQSVGLLKFSKYWGIQNRSLMVVAQGPEAKHALQWMLDSSTNLKGFGSKWRWPNWDIPAYAWKIKQNNSARVVCRGQNSNCALSDHKFRKHYTYIPYGTALLTMKTNLLNIGCDNELTDEFSFFHTWKDLFTYWCYMITSGAFFCNVTSFFWKWKIPSMFQIRYVLFSVTT
jgi:hypothetical protein